MENIIKRGKSEKVCKKQGRISRGGGEKFIWLARIYRPAHTAVRTTACKEQIPAQEGFDDGGFSIIRYRVSKYYDRHNCSSNVNISSTL